MAEAYGANFSNSDSRKLAPGAIHDAGVRAHKNIFDLATNGGGGTTANLNAAKVREGQSIEGARLSSSVDLSGLTFTVGTDASPSKYAQALAGPVANATVTYPIRVSALMADPLATPETIKFFPSGNLPAAGTVITQINSSMR